MKQILCIKLVKYCDKQSKASFHFEYLLRRMHVEETSECLKEDTVLMFLETALVTNTDA